MAFFISNSSKNREGKFVKKIVLAFLLVLMSSTLALGDGTVTVSRHHVSADGKILVVRLTCVGDAVDGSVPVTAISPDVIGTIPDPVKGQINDYTKAGFYLYEVSVITGVTKPDAADLTIVDASGNTPFTQANVIPAAGASYGIVGTFRPITGGVTAYVTNQATASATYVIDLKFAR